MSKKSAAPAKSATVTLHAGGSTLTLLATRKGTAAP
jgi:hypothetical protein